MLEHQRISNDSPDKSRVYDPVHAQGVHTSDRCERVLGRAVSLEGTLWGRRVLGGHHLGYSAGSVLERVARHAAMSLGATDQPPHTLPPVAPRGVATPNVHG